MLSDKEIIKQAHQRINDCLLVQAWWRANEVRDNYNIIEGDQWLEDPYDRQNADGMPIRTINKLAPVVDAISGFEIQNRTKANYVPILAQKEKEGFADLANDGAKYLESQSQAVFQNSLSFKDMLICGVGVTRNSLSYDDNPDGAMQVKRIFPYLALWDVASREKNLEDANWVMEARVVDKDAMEGYIKNAQDAEEADANFGAAVDARFLDFFNTVMIVKSLGIIYEYEWREKVPFYRVNNPLFGFEGNQNDPYVMQIVTLAKMLQDEYKLDVVNDQLFSIEKKEYKEIKRLFEFAGLPFKSTKQKKWRYYKATIVGNKLFDKEENYSQTGFSLKFMTGKFSEVRQCHYGIVRASKEAQRLLNQAVSDYEGFLKTIPKGGVEIEADAVPNMQAFIQTYTKAREVTIYNPGGLAKTRPKMAPPVPAGLLDMINLASASIMETTGVTPDFMGITDSKLMTAKLNGQLVRQGLTVLSPYFDAKQFYTIAQGRLFIDALRIMAENAEGRLIRVLDQGEAKYIPLLKDGLAAEYDIVIEEMPQSPSERQDMFEKLLQMASLLANKPNPIDLMPMVVQYSPLKEHQIEQITQLMAPPPPQPPDPVTQGLLVAETKLKESTAEKNMADTVLKRMDMLLKQKELANVDQQMEAAIHKVMADAKLSQARAIAEQVKPHNQETK